MKTVTRYKKTLLLFACIFLHTIYVFAGTTNGDQPLSATLLQKELSRYMEIEKKGGWQKINLNKKQYLEGESAPVIKQVKQRLHATGDLSVKDTSMVFTGELEEAVKKVQRQLGLKETGAIEALLVMGLNVPVGKRIEQLQINLNRLRLLPVASQGKRIVVNIPEYKLHVYEGGNHVFDMNVVVGTTANKTAIFNDELTHIVFSPYWNVPASIVQNEIVPAMKKRRNYLSANGYEQTGTANGLQVIRQKPGKNNSLGLVKFLFPNEHDIYFHDTPVKSLFGQRIRAYSHGCVRLAEPVKLAEYLLKNSAGWTPSKISEAMNAGKEQWVKLDAVVPVYITYFTAWVDKDGKLNFRDDIYGYDKGLPMAAASFNSNVTAGIE